MPDDYRRQKAYRLRKAAQIVAAARMEKAIRDALVELGENVKPLAMKLREILTDGLGDLK